ncbi:hypothetical protein GQ600_12698 [Phytophthora cactorum]|nr:hypothetical protein GQ600_12698 [Phytophthora cactorum]
MKSFRRYGRSSTVPALRGLRPNADTQATEDDESRKDHHHHHVKVVKKVKKIAIPVPVEVPQFIPVPVSVPSTVVASSNNAVVSSNNNVVAAPVPVLLARVLQCTRRPRPSAPGPATPAPTTLGGRPAPTLRPRQLEDQGPRQHRLTWPMEALLVLNYQHPKVAVQAWLEFHPRQASEGFGGANRMGALGGVGGPGAGMGGGFWKRWWCFGQQMGPGMQGGNTFGGFGGQGAMGSVGQAGNNGSQAREEGNSALEVQHWAVATAW